MVYLSFVDLDQSCHELVILWVTSKHNEIAQFHDCIHCIVDRVNEKILTLQIFKSLNTSNFLG